MQNNVVCKDKVRLSLASFFDPVSNRLCGILTFLTEHSGDKHIVNCFLMRV